VMSMVGYVLGLGDRHPSNLMLDRRSGKVLHIDFGDCFEVAMQREKFPEKVPFRLTRMLVNAMEVSGIEGNYRLTCEKVMKVLRENNDSLVATLEAFVHDPLISWRLLNIDRRKTRVGPEGKGSFKAAEPTTPTTTTTSAYNEVLNSPHLEKIPNCKSSGHKNATPPLLIVSDSSDIGEGRGSNGRIKTDSEGRDMTNLGTGEDFRLMKVSSNVKEEADGDVSKSPAKVRPNIPPLSFPVTQDSIVFESKQATDMEAPSALPVNSSSSSSNNSNASSTIDADNDHGNNGKIYSTNGVLRPVPVLTSPPAPAYPSCFVGGPRRNSSRCVWFVLMVLIIHISVDENTYMDVRMYVYIYLYVYIQVHLNDHHSHHIA
jgi:hypothetical protein